MWRAFFLAVGTYAVILGAEALAIDKAELKASSTNQSPFAPRFGSATKEIEPPDWAPWSLISGGAVTILYSFTLPAKMKGG